MSICSDAANMADKNETDDAATQEKEDESTEDVDMQDEESSGDEEDDEDHSARIAELKNKLKQNPYLYEPHLELIKLLQADGELEGLREAREAMSKAYPLTEALWLDWLKDEIGVAQSPEEREKVHQLFQRAVKDYLGVYIWLEYVQFAIGDMGAEGGMERMRQIFERALTACGLHTTMGATIWEAYRELENAVLAGMQPAPGSIPSKEQHVQQEDQTKRVKALFRRQLGVPLMDMAETYREYVEWSGDDPDPHIKNTYEKTAEKLKALMVYEDKLLTAEDPKLEAYMEYIDYEMKCDDPARIQCIFERAIQDNCLVPELWIKYTKYLTTKLQIPSVIIDVHERAIRNCSWSSQLVISYAQAMERCQQPHEKIASIFDTALNSGFTSGADILSIWTAYCDYMRRRIDWQAEHDTELNELRATFERAVVHINTYYPMDGDPNCTLHQYRARIEARLCDNMAKCREMWNEIMQAGFGNQAQMWLEFFSIERAYGDSKHCRKLLQRAINSVSDWPESVCDAYISYEQQEGTLETYDTAVARCEAQLKRIEGRRAQAAEKEAKVEEKKTQQRKEKQAEKKAAQKREKAQQKPLNPQGRKVHHPSCGQYQAENAADTASVRPYQRKTAASPETSVKDEKSTEDEVTMDGSPVKHDQEGFKVPPPPGLKRPHSPSTKSAPPPGYRGPPPGAKSRGPPPPGFKGPPPPGYKPKTESTEEPPEKRLKEDDTDQTSVEPHPTDDSARLACTVFVSNINFQVKEERLKEIFEPLGEIREVRLIKGFQGKSKGYAYVEFTDEAPVAEALKKDREPLDGRPMFVSECHNKEGKSQAFKYSTALEKKKLFVKGLPFEMTKEQLTELFEKHGKVEDVRLVTYRTGASKGIAYIDYAKEAEASAAILKMDGTELDGMTISVAISNPPPRKTPATQREFIPTLGSGKKDMGAMGKARTQVAFTPRSLNRQPAEGRGAQKPASHTTSAPSNGSAGETSNSKTTTTKMSNSDFRKMLLNK